ISAAMSAVVTPIQTTTVREEVTPLIAPNEKSGYTRATRNTPAATMVAAWINAETGVGPSIASGNHTCSGNWADFPTAPQKIKSAAMVRHTGLFVNIDIRSEMSAKTTEPVVIQTMRMPSMNPKSPMRVVMNAL